MTHLPPTTDPRSDARADELAIEHLLLEAGERVQPTAAITHAVQAAVHAEWQAMVAQRTRRKQILNWSMAASISAVALGALLLFRYTSTPQSSLVAMASIVKIQPAAAALSPSISLTGNAQISTSNGATWSDARAGDVLLVGMVVRTDPSTRVALNVGNALSVRLDVGTHIELLAADQIRLARGRIYVDAPSVGADAGAVGHAPLTVLSTLGSVEHLGTQYQVQVTQDRMTVSVREGQVAVTTNNSKAQIVANEHVTFGAHGEIVRDTIVSHDLSWQWTVQAAPAFEIENRSLASFLDWVARETGRKVIYSTLAVHAQAEQLVLRGSVANLTPDQALHAVLATTPFKQTDTDAVIKISL